MAQSFLGLVQRCTGQGALTRLLWRSLSLLLPYLLGERRGAVPNSSGEDGDDAKLSLCTGRTVPNRRFCRELRKKNRGKEMCLNKCWVNLINLPDLMKMRRTMGAGKRTDNRRAVEFQKYFGILEREGNDCRYVRRNIDLNMHTYRKYWSGGRCLKINIFRLSGEKGDYLTTRLKSRN